jgi:hypothetical protein
MQAALPYVDLFAPRPQTAEPGGAPKPYLGEDLTMSRADDILDVLIKLKSKPN